MLEIEICGGKVRIENGGRCVAMTPDAEAAADSLNQLIANGGGRHSYLPAEDERVFREIIQPRFPSVRVLRRVPAKTRRSRPGEVF